MFSRNREFAEAYNDLYPVLFGAIYSRVNSMDDAEDICQELFIKLYNKLSEVENKRKWLFGAMKYELMNYYKKKRPGDMDINEHFDDVGLGYVNGFRDTRIMINDAIEDMDNFDNETDRALFDLVAVKNFTYEEAGAHLGLSKRQVRYRYGLIIDRLMDYFKKRGIQNIEELL
jgi:RNA polymerase sigma factor (sigma-70 family)